MKVGGEQSVIAWLSLAREATAGLPSLRVQLRVPGVGTTNENVDWASPLGDERYPSDVADHTTIWTRLEVSSAGIPARLSGLTRPAALEGQELDWLGLWLGNRLLPPDARELLFRTAAIAGPVELRLKAHSDLGAIPWEWTSVRRDGRDVRLSEIAHLVRQDDRAWAKERDLSSHRVLILDAFDEASDDTAAIAGQMATDRHWEVLNLRNVTRAQLDVFPWTSGVAVVYVAAHLLDGKGARGAIQLSDGTTLDVAELAAFLRLAGTRLCILNVCLTATQVGEGGPSWLNELMAATALEAVVGIQGFIDGFNESAPFGSGVMTALSNGAALGRAVTAGRNRLSDEGLSRAFGLPVVMTAREDHCILESAADKGPSEAFVVGEGCGRGWACGGALLRHLPDGDGPPIELLVPLQWGASVRVSVQRKTSPGLSVEFPSGVAEGLKLNVLESAIRSAVHTLAGAEPQFAIRVSQLDVDPSITSDEALAASAVLPAMFRAVAHAMDTRFSHSTLTSLMAREDIPACDVAAVPSLAFVQDDAVDALPWWPELELVISHVRSPDPSLRTGRSGADLERGRSISAAIKQAASDRDAENFYRAVADSRSYWRRSLSQLAFEAPSELSRSDAVLAITVSSRGTITAVTRPGHGHVVAKGFRQGATVVPAIAPWNEGS